MYKAKRHFPLGLSLFFILLPQVYSVIQDCYPQAGRQITLCPIYKGHVNDPYADVVRRTVANSYNCVKGRDYGYRHDGRGPDSIWIRPQCGGSFIVTIRTQPPVVTTTRPVIFQWSNWSPCSVTCGTGTRTRTRNQLCAGNQYCPQTQSGACYVQNCPSQLASWNVWAAWSSCSKSCGWGSRVRYRTCSTGRNTDCSASTNANLELGSCYATCNSVTTGTDTVVCYSRTYQVYTYCRTSQNIPNADVTMINGWSNNCVKGQNYGYFYNNTGGYVYVRQNCGGTFRVTSAQSTLPNWGQWSACNVQCGYGKQIRVRLCLNGQVSTYCNQQESRTCYQNCGNTNTNIASWNNWQNWGACSLNCGGGTQIRIRTCSTGRDTDCSANVNDNKQILRCNTQACNAGSGTVFPNQLSCGKAPINVGVRIIGGIQAQRCQFPWMVAIVNTLTKKNCAGTIINPTHILTVAECISTLSRSGALEAVSPNYIQVLSGTNVPLVNGAIQRDAIVRYASKVKIHENFSSNPQLNLRVNDISIVTLTTPINFDTCHVPICLPSAQQTATGAPGCKVTGYGMTSNQQAVTSVKELRFADITIRDPSACYRQYNAGKFDSERNLCAGGYGRGTCGGDKGSPLACLGPDNRYYQYGIASLGTQGFCGTTPGMYTKVTKYLSWIKYSAM